MLFGSAAAAWPTVARAQKKAMPVIGYIHSASPGPPPPAFHGGLSETGYVEGQNVAIEFRSAEGVYDRLPALAAELVGRDVDVILAVGGIVSTRAKGLRLVIVRAATANEIEAAFAL